MPTRGQSGERTVSYAPPGADATGVTIVADTGVVVTITNDFSARESIETVTTSRLPSGASRSCDKRGTAT